MCGRARLQATPEMTLSSCLLAVTRVSRRLTLVIPIIRGIQIPPPLNTACSNPGHILTDSLSFFIFSNTIRTHILSIKLFVFSSKNSKFWFILIFVRNATAAQIFHLLATIKVSFANTYMTNYSVKVTVTPSIDHNRSWRATPNDHIHRIRRKIHQSQTCST